MDIEKKKVKKGSKPRIFKMSSKLLNMLNNLPKTKEHVFTYKMPRISIKALEECAEEQHKN